MCQHHQLASQSSLRPPTGYQYQCNPTPPLSPYKQQPAIASLCVPSMIICLSLCLALLGTCLSQGQVSQVRFESVSNPNRFDFSFIATGAPDGSVLIAGIDFLTRVAPDFQQVSISNVQNLPSTLSLVAFDHFNIRYMACSRDRTCHFYNTSDVSAPVGNVFEPFSGEDNIPRFAVFAALAGKPAVYVYGSFRGTGSLTTRYSLDAFQLDNLVSSAALFTGQPRNTPFDLIRKLINTFTYGDRIYFLVRHIPGVITYSTRLFTVCNNTAVSGDRFISVLEVDLDPCNSGYTYLVTGRQMTLQDGQSHLVLVYRQSAESVQSVLCTVSLSDLTAFIADNFNSETYSSGLFWPVNSETNTDNLDSALALLLGMMSLCDFKLSTFVFALMMSAAAPAAPVPLLPSAYSAQPNQYGRVVTLLVSQLEGLSYIFVFTDEGFQLKYYIDGSSLTSDLTLLEARPVSATFRDRVSALEPSGSSHILALTPRELLRIPLDDCGRHATCLACVSDTDPLCGWCSAQRLCSKRTDCQNNNLTNRWRDTDSSTCLSVSAVSPDISSVIVATNITVSAANLPQLANNNAFLCVFQSLGSTQISAVTGGNSLTGPAVGPVNLTCPTPPNDLANLNQSESRTVELYLSTSEFPEARLGGSFDYTLFDCSFHTSCQECVSPSDLSPCGWCVYSGECTHASSLCPALNTSQGYQWVQDSSCISLSPLPPNSSFATEDTNTFQLSGSNLPPPTSSFQYQCQLMHGNSWYNMSADYLSSSSIECSLPAGAISVPSPAIYATLHLSLGDRTLFQFQFSLYSCGQQGSSCAECLSNPATAPLCGWCVLSAGDTCDTNRCQGDFLQTTCPNPQILSVSPASLTVHYTDPIRIVGTDLGTVTDTLWVTLDNNLPTPTTFQRSVIVPNLQSIGREINCTIMGLLFSSLRLPGIAYNFTLTLDIQGSLGETRSASHAPVLIASPLILSVAPSFGPVAGGTRVRVSGVGLGLGSSLSAEIIGASECTIVSPPSYADGDLECITKPTPTARNGQFAVMIDSTTYRSTSGLFRFRQNPQIFSLSPKAVIPSSNVSVTFEGVSLNAAANPIIRFLSGRAPGDYPCEVFEIMGGVVALMCPFPQADTSATKRQTGGQSAVNFTLVYDGFQLFPGSALVVSIKPDPTFMQDSHQISDDSHVTVNSVNTSVLLTFMRTTDYASVGLSGLFSVELELSGVSANISSVVTYNTGFLSVQLFNIPVDTVETRTFDIFVSLGDYRTPAGSLKVLSGLGSVANKGYPYIALAGLLISLVLILGLVLVLCCVFCCLRKRSRVACAEVEKLLFEMDTIGNSVAEACLSEFAELNIELGYAADLTQGSGAAPFLSFHKFVMNVMFPGQPDHPVMHPVRTPPGIGNAEFFHALELFDQLLRDKDYFLSLVNCIESNRSFSLRDRSNIASLFALCMHEDIQYLTEVLKTLLEDLVERMVAQSRAKLMFRRTDSVAEKLLSDWLAMLMYGHLIEGAGPAIHLAYRATKRQTEKGPVDVFTGEARHSLAKEKILTQLADIEDMKEVEAEVITEKEECLTVKLLDCDTISQSKLKIMDVVYSGMPVSQRPLPTELELELHSRRPRKQGAGLILRDNDHTSVVLEDWKRVNTLSHYGAISQVFKLVPRTQKLHGGQVFDYMGTLLQSPSQRQGAHRDKTQQEEERVWHLVKPQEQTQAIAKSRKLVTEISLTRLVSTKNILQKYLDDMMNAIFPDLSLEPHKLPPPIKFLFDLLEQQAESYDIDDRPNVVRLWKNNSVALRFWVTLVRNPEYLFDVTKSETVESNLTVLAQVFIDSCLAKDYQGMEDAQTTSILYNKEVPVYRERIMDYYEKVSNSPPVSEEMLFGNYQVPRGGDHFYRESALQALYSYAHSCKDKLVEEMLDGGRFKQQVAKFEEIFEIFSRHSNC